MIWNTLFEPKETLDIPSSPYYKEAILKVVAGEAKRPDLPILYNVNFGHAEPTAILPYGVKARLDADKKTLILLEPGAEY